MSLVVILFLSYAIDRVIGEPPNRFHPVCWMGSLLGTGRRFAPKAGNARRFVWGTLLILFGGTLVIGLGFALESVGIYLPVYANWVLQAFLLKTTFSVASLAKAGSAVIEPLEREDLSEARHQLSYHLVSRSTTELNSSDIAAAAIESVAENTSDSFVAPLFFYCFAGLPGALFYRWVNTADAMLGYRTAELEWLGKFAARLDDCLNWIPARLTAMAMLIAGVLGHWDWRVGLRTWRRDSQLTASPNAGHPMSMAAGLLKVALEKKGHYILGHEFSKPNVNDLKASIRIMWYTSIIVILALSTLIVSSTLSLQYWEIRS